MSINISARKAMITQRMVWGFMADALEAILLNVVLEEDGDSYYTATLREAVEMMYQKYHFHRGELEIVSYHREYNFLCAHSFEWAEACGGNRCDHCPIHFASHDFPAKEGHRACWMEYVVIETLFDKYFELNDDADADIREAIVLQLKKMFRELAELPERDLQ